jgi:hypothetical protein
VRSLLSFGFSSLRSSFDGVARRFKKFSTVKVLGVMFLVGFLVRLVPELLAGALPIGFDTVHYAAAMQSGVVFAHWSSFFTSSWLFYALTVPVYGLLQVDPFLLLKVMAPALYGLNVAGIYFFARKVLGWDFRMGVFAGVFFALQLAALRISWDLLRNTLGMGLLLFALAYVREVDSKRGFKLFSVLSLLCVFAHEYAAATLLVAVLGLVVWRMFKRQLFSGAKRLLLGVLPALAVFVVGMALRFFPVGYVAETNVIEVGETVTVKAGGLFFLENYLATNSSVISYAGYWDLALNVVLLFALLFLPYIFLVVRGFFRNHILNFWTGLLLVGAFGCLLVPVAALEVWYRWMFMLVYPFTFYAVSGFGRLAGWFSGNCFRFCSWFSSKKAVVMVLLTWVLGVAYLATPALMILANTSLPMPLSLTLYFSTSPTVPYEDERGVVAAMSWLDDNMDGFSVVVLESVFFFYGQLYLDKDKPIIYVQTDLDLAVQTAFDREFGSVYFVYWNQPIGWVGVSVPEGFVSVRDFGRISVYAYEV